MCMLCFAYFSETAVEVPTGNPCIPSPCGSNSQCKVVGTQPACSCLANFIGRPPNCRPECTINEECPGNLACQNEKCKDPCPGACGSFSTCTVIKHRPICHCIEGYTGDPFNGCSIIVACKNFYFTFISSSFHFKLYSTCYPKTTDSLQPVTMWSKCNL